MKTIWNKTWSLKILAMLKCENRTSLHEYKISDSLVWIKRDLGRVQSKYFFLNITTLFNQMQPYNLYM